MEKPWANANPSLTSNMHVYKRSVVKKKKEQEKETKPEEIVQTKELEEPKSKEVFMENQSETVDETKETKIDFPAEMTYEFHPHNQGEICYITKKIPFSAHVAIDDFLHNPICGDITQHTFVFQDQDNQKVPEMDTKLLHTIASYSDDPECRLVNTNIHEMIYLTTAYDFRGNNGHSTTTIAVPLHESKETAAETSNGSCIHIRVPVVLGEYKIELCLEETIELWQNVMQIKEISKEIILTNCKFLPIAFSPSLKDGTRAIHKGSLWIEGYIDQKIEYTAYNDRSKTSVSPMTHLGQKVVTELIVHILQVQKVQVKQ